jgi:hypothetical protein
VTSSQTNQHELALYGGLKPLEDLNVNTRWLVRARQGRGRRRQCRPARQRLRRDEWDMSSLRLTDDVQLGFLYALFLPGDVFRDGGDAGSATRPSWSAPSA